jgi:AbiV family abortive infection protein
MIDLKKLRLACINNSRKLFEKSLDEYNSHNWEYAAFLAITSHEEALKAGLVKTLEEQLITKEKFKKIWHSHNLKLLSKHAKIIVYENISTGKTFMEFEIPEKDKIRDPKSIDDILITRNNSLYTDFKDEVIYSPKETVKQKHALKYIKMVKQTLEWEEMMIDIEKKLKQ